MSNPPAVRNHRTVSLAGLGAAAVHGVLPRLIDLPQDPDGVGLGPSVSMPTLTAVALAAGVGAVVSLRFRLIGAAVLGVAAVASVVLVLWEFEPIVGLLPLALTIPTLLLLFSPSAPQPSTAGRRSAMATIVAASVFIFWRAGRRLDRLTDAAHPESSVEKPDWLADWMWVGAVSPTSATITAGGLAPGPHQLLHWTGNPATGAAADARVISARPDAGGVARFPLTDLAPGSDYRYRIGREGSRAGADATFRTYEADPHAVTVAFGSCARTGSNGAVFDAIRATEPDLFVQLGDLHYGNLVSTDPDDHLRVLSRAISTPAQSALFSGIPTGWVWDDHDFCDNDSGAADSSRHAVSVAYRRAVPHWSVDPDPAKPINQAFTIGRVRIIIIDTRSMRSSISMLGHAQEAWLLEELTTASRTHAAVIWANPAPWNVPDRPGSDQWGGYADQRRRIANTIADNDVSNLVMISGDWHVSAIDDGTNTAFAENGAGGFPLIHGAPLDRPGAGVRETYSHGVFSNAGQFGTVRVVDDGSAMISAILTVHLWTGEVLGELEIPIDASHLA